MWLNVYDVVAFLFCEEMFETLNFKSLFSVNGFERIKLISADKVVLKMVLFPSKLVKQT